MSEQPELQPQFTNIRGAIHGYAQRNNGVSKANLKAFFAEMQGCGGLMERASDLTWDEVWEAINHFQMFWCAYYAGHERVVTVKTTPNSAWAQEVSDMEGVEISTSHTRLAELMEMKAQKKA